METVWTFNTARFCVRLRIEEETGYQYDGEDEGGETQAALDSGEFVAFTSIVEVLHKGTVIGSDVLGGSVYKADDMAEFWTAHRSADPMQRNCSIMRAAHGQRTVIAHYFPGMVAEAIKEARAFMASLCQCPDPATPAPAQPAPMDEGEALLRAHGFEDELGGGGAVFLSRYWGEYGPDGAAWSIWATCEEGQGMPTESDYCLGVYGPDKDHNEAVALFYSCEKPLAFALEQALAMIPPEFPPMVFPADHRRTHAALDRLSDEAREYGFVLQEGGACPAFLARFTADRRAVTIGTDGPIETADPRAAVWRLGGMQSDGDYLPDIGEAYPEPMALLVALAFGREAAMKMDSAPVQTMPGRTWQTEFPEYPADGMPALPPHWEDVSWHNDACPHFICYRAVPESELDSLAVWIGHPQPGGRDFPDEPRFTLESLNQIGEGRALLYHGDDWQAVLAAILAYAMDRPISTRKQAETFIRALVDADKDFHLDDDPSDVFDVRTDARTFTDEEAAKVAERQREIFALDCWTREDCPHGVALAYLTAIGRM